jgi:hypothetical protein
MTNKWYPKYVEAALKGGSNVDLTSGTIKASLIDTDDQSYDAADEFIDDIASGAIVATATLSSPSVSGKQFDAGDATFSSVTGDESEAIIIWKDTGTASTSRVVLWLDTGITGLPVTPSGGDILTAWGDYIASLGA